MGAGLTATVVILGRENRPPGALSAEGEGGHEDAPGRQKERNDGASR